MSVFSPRLSLSQRVDILNVKSFGARGDGVTNDGAAIQAALDSAYGPPTIPNGGNFKYNKAVFFPAGTYLVDQQIFLNQVQGACLLGAGQRATRLLYTGGATNLPKGDVTALLTCRSMDYSHIEGITFDVTGSNATVAVQLMNFASIQADGTGNMWFDDGFVGGSDDGFLIGSDGSGATGSEELFVGCLFDSNTTAVFINSGNALDYSFVGCRFQNNGRGIYCVVGAVNLIKGCSFNNPGFASFIGSVSGTTLTVSGGVTGAIARGQQLLGTGDNQTFIESGSGNTWTLSRSQSFGNRALTSSSLDIYIKQNQAPVVIGCNSVSPNFCVAGPVWIAGCRHNPSNAGYLWLGGIDDNPAHGTIEGCLAGANSGLFAADAYQIAYLKGNTFNNAGYLTNFSTTVSFTGSISGTTLTTTGSPHLLAGQYITGTGVAANTRIISGGFPGNSWGVTPSQTVSSTSMSTVNVVENI